MIVLFILPIFCHVFMSFPTPDSFEAIGVTFRQIVSGSITLFDILLGS